MTRRLAQKATADLKNTGCVLTLGFFTQNWNVPGKNWAKPFDVLEMPYSAGAGS